ncbi:MAG: glycosyltransferase family 2 protein [Phycisphaerales bacterium]
MNETNREHHELDCTIIVVSYNTRDLTLQCLRSVVAETSDVSFEVIVIDNASTDGSAEAIENEFPNLTLIKREDNLGFAAANNVAVELARGEYLLLLNPDTIVLDGAVQKLMAFARSTPKAGIWGGKTLFADRTLNPHSVAARMTLRSLLCNVTGLRSMFRNSAIFNPEQYGGWKRDSVREVDIVVGCFLLIKRHTWKRLGGFDPAFFMYGEEADLCLRARRLGCQPIMTPEAAIVHYGGASEKLREDKVVRLLRSKTLLIDRHWSRFTAPLGKALLRWSIFARTWTRSVPAFPRSIRERASIWKAVWRRRAEWART